MGDVVELSVWPDHRNTFYRISSGGFVFEVKAGTNAGIGLSRKPGSQCDYWIVLGHEYYGYRTWIKKVDSGAGKKCRVPNLINWAQYRRFWLSWKNGCIQLGRYGETDPIIWYNNNLDLSYVTFSVGRDGMIPGGNVVHWRFEVPPPLEKPILKPFTGGKMQWVQAPDDQLPDGALIGGYENESLYIIRAPHVGSLTPGKFVPSQGAGFISWGGEAHEKNAFEVLCGFDCTWVPTYEDRIPIGAVEGGNSESGEKLYVGRVLYNTHMIPGKVQPSHKVCYIAYDGREIGQKKYEILVCPNVKIKSINRKFLDFIDYGSPPGSDEENEDNDEDEYYDYDDD